MFLSFQKRKAHKGKAHKGETRRSVLFLMMGHLRETPQANQTSKYYKPLGTLTQTCLGPKKRISCLTNMTQKT